MSVTVAVIPARGGSKGLLDKNLVAVAGIPLVGRAVSAALNADRIDAVFVSSDDPEILECAWRFGAKTIERPADISRDSSSSEAAILAALDCPDVAAMSPDTVVMIQCTSPFTRSEDLDALVALLDDQRFDASTTVIEDHGFLWKTGVDGVATGLNHDASQMRQRRQDLPPQYRETGAAYAMRVGRFRETGLRFCGPVGLVMTRHPPIEIDTAEDLELAQAFASRFDAPRYEDVRFGGVRALVTDFDGVHTDDRVWVDERGFESVRCSRSDGMGIERLREAGIPVLILSREENSIVEKRAAKLQVPVIHGETNKLAALERWAAETCLGFADICFVGNDLNDVQAMRSVGLAVTPSDARDEAKAVADIVLQSAGGDGAVREICDYLLAAHGQDAKSRRGQ